MAALPGRMRLLVAGRVRRARLLPRRTGARVGLAVCLLFCALSLVEIRTSALQSWLLSRYAARLSWTIGPGASPSVVFPAAGPFDVSRGYALLPDFQRRLEGRGFRVAEQALIAPSMARLARWGIPLPYGEPPLVGLVLRDARGRTLYDARVRIEDGQFRSPDEIPAVVLDSLLFIENRELGESAPPRSNPAVDWKRFTKAGLLYTGSKLGLPVRVEGGSTLATQLEKYRHSPEGRTGSAADKLRQMVGASLRAYLDGPDTRGERREIVLEYLNTMPLAVAPGYGEVYGLGQGLRVWFGTTLRATCDALRDPGFDEVRRARAFKRTLALLYAVRAPSHYLLRDRSMLETKIDAYAGLLADAGIIDARLCRLARRTPLKFANEQAARDAARRETPDPRRKTADTVRADVMELLDAPGFYELDRLDLQVETTLDGALEKEASRLFADLKDPAFLDANALRGERLLSQGDPSRVVYSLLLYERAPGANLLRARVDSLDRPFDLNEGMKMELGSTAKLRVLAHYLGVAARLYEEMSSRETPELVRLATVARDPITRWAAGTLARGGVRSLRGLLDAALERTYSASPAEVFYTGGGAHRFANFDRADDSRTMTVREATARSTNLVFIRLMRDLVRFHEARLPYDTQRVLERPDDPQRHRLLEEIADDETKQRLSSFWRQYRGKAPSDIPAHLLSPRASAPRLAIVYYAWHPGGDTAGLSEWLAGHGAPVTPAEARRLAAAYGNPRLTLQDYGFLLKKHPLEVWCAGEVAKDPAIAWSDLLERSGPARAEASRWLFRARSRAAQDLRLRIRFERDAFDRMTPEWRRLGFPFEKLVPSLATAIGSSADRPAALAGLMGIILNDGVRRPELSVLGLLFAAGTPYHTLFEPRPEDGARVMPAMVARTLKGVLAGVVQEGTAQRVKGVFVGADGGTVTVGGKTGSGDNRYETFARGGSPISSRAVSRTAAFVFYIGSRYYGVVTASVTGQAAGEYRFTSSLPLAVLKLLAPALNQRLAVPAAPAARREAPAQLYSKWKWTSTEVLV